ncbi:MAG: NAD(P)-dependent oxidoreductase [Candidatus Omnitrophota bacterium]
MKKIENNNCLVVGAGGFIGRRIIKALQNNLEVFTILRKKTNIFLSKKIKLINIDLLNKCDLLGLPKRIDMIIYLAQSEKFRDFPETASDIFQVNTVGVLRFLEYAKKAGAKTFILASSGGLDKVTDARLESNLGFYYTTKLCSEMLAKSYSPFMNIIILRPFFVYGRGQRKNMLIPRLVDAVKKEKPILLDGRNGIKINPLHISDATSAIIKATSLTGQYTIDIAGPKAYTMRQIGEIIGKKLNKKPIFRIKKKKDSCNFIGNISKMTKLLTSPCISFEEGIEDLV